MPEGRRYSLLIVTQNYPRRLVEWAGEFLIRQARFLAPHGIDTRFIMPRPLAPWPIHKHPHWRIYGPENPVLNFPEMPVRVARYPRPPGAWMLQHDAWFMRGPVVRTARRWAREQPFDLVLGVQMNSEAQCAVAIGEQLDIPVATLAIGTDLMVMPDRYPVLRDQLVETMRHVALPMAVSKPLAAILESTGTCTRAPFLARVPRETEAFRPAEDRAAVRRAFGYAEDDLVGVFVGRLEEAKGIGDLCEVLPALLAKHPRFRMVLLGDGALQARLREIGDAVRPGSVVADGRVEPDRVPAHLQASDLLVFPSHSEGLPQAVLEAMDCGLPVVAADVGGVAEAVLDGETGLLVPPKAPERLAEAIERLLGDASLRERFGARGRAWAREAFDPERNSAELARELLALVEKRGRKISPPAPQAPRDKA